MRATDWTYYQAHDYVRPNEYHADWPDELQELGPIKIPAGPVSTRGVSHHGPDVLWKDSVAKDCRHKATEVVGESSGTTGYPQAHVEN